MFQYQPGSSVLHRSDIRVKLIIMIALSLVLIQVSVFRLSLLLPFLLLLQCSLKRRPLPPPLPVLFMPALIFTGNFLSLAAGDALLSSALITAGLRTVRFTFILWMAQLFTETSDPMCLTPAFYRLLKHIPLIPAGRISTQLGLSLTLIPVILEEMNEIRDAMISRCGWNPRSPLKNLVHMGQPLLNGVLLKAEALSDAMEARLFTEDSTEPELLGSSSVLLPLLAGSLFILILLAGEYVLSRSGSSSFFVQFF